MFLVGPGPVAARSTQAHNTTTTNNFTPADRPAHAPTHRRYSPNNGGNATSFARKEKWDRTMQVGLCELQAKFPHMHLIWVGDLNACTDEDDVAGPPVRPSVRACVRACVRVALLLAPSFFVVVVQPPTNQSTNQLPSSTP